MKKILILFALCSLPALAATAPDSIAGKVYHENGGPTNQITWGFVISFSADGRYSFLTNWTGSVFGNYDALRPLFLRPLPNDGTYTYTRIGETTATITMTDPAGTLGGFTSPLVIDSVTSIKLQLSFSTDSGGTQGVDGFYLTDATNLQSAPAINLSLRGAVSPGHPLIGGFVIPTVPPASNDSHYVLIRAVGTTLSQFGVTGVWTSPDFQLFNGADPGHVGAHFAGWSQDAKASANFQKIFGLVGAFPLPLKSKDTVGFVILTPGAYTVVCIAAPGDPGGEALIEVYFLP